MSRSNIFKMLMIETLENSLSGGVPSTFNISWVSITAFWQDWYSRVAAWQHFHRGAFDLKAVILAQPRLVRSRNSCKMSACQTSLYVLPEYFVISLMLANVIPGWRQLVVVWDTEDPVKCKCTEKKCCSTFGKHLFQHAWKNWFWIGFRVKIRLSLKVYEIQVFPLPDFNKNV